MRRFFLALVLVLVIGLAFPVANLWYSPGTTGKLAALRAGDSEFGKVATLLERRCACCHTEGATLPFYVDLPVAGNMVRSDIEQGLRHIEFSQAFAAPAGQPVSEAAIARIECVMKDGSMPPARFLWLHWNARLSPGEREGVLAWVKDVRQTHYAASDVAPQFRNEPVQPLPLEVKLDARKVALGDKLYHDSRLSGDDTLSCASCHALDKAGTDQAQFSTGIRGQKGDINAPTTFNAGFIVRQFWDGRAETLEDQAKGPVENPVEMGARWDDVIVKLRADPAYQAEFRALFPDKGLTVDTVAEAIATFERSLVSVNSRFDRYLRGDKNAITDGEHQGYELFKSMGCVCCHVGAPMGGQSFERMGLRRDYFKDRGRVDKPDAGRFNFTRREADRFKFKVPTLRNVALTHPYFHHGEVNDLKEAVRVMTRYQIDVEAGPAEIDRIVEFLHSVTGEYRGKSL